MISLAPTHPGPSRELLNHEGGFLWWYAEALDEAGNGLVLIWSFGLPFLPSWAGPAREGVRAALRTRPAINIALYSEGRLDGYWLEELDPADARWDGAERWRFGNSRFEITRRDGRLLLDAELDVRTPGAAESLQGQVTFDTVAARVERGFAWDQRHAWTPLAGPGRADWALRCGARTWAGEGAPYLDRNHGEVMLHELGIHTWHWGHGSFADEQRIAYALVGEGGEARAFGVSIHADGRVEVRDDLRARFGPARRTLFGMRERAWWAVEDDAGTWLRCDASLRVDDGFFYLRHLGPAARGAERAFGSSEVIQPGRVDLPRHRALVHMRIGRAGRDSIWSPLFTGPRAGRLGRLLQHWGAAA